MTRAAAASAIPLTVLGLMVNLAGLAGRAGAVPEYLDVSRQGAPAPRGTLDHDRFGPVALPGLAVLHRSADGTAMNSCSLGPAVQSVDGTRSGFVTAGHCAVDHPDQFLQIGADGQVTPLGSASDVVSSADYLVDSAVIWVPRGIDPHGATIAGVFPVTGVMPVDQVRALPMGTPICIDGTTSGVVCAGLVGAGDRIEYAKATREGDSGAPVFVVDGSRHAILIGIHQGIDVAGNSDATYLAPALARFGAVAATA